MKFTNQAEMHFFSPLGNILLVLCVKLRDNIV